MIVLLLTTPPPRAKTNVCACGNAGIIPLHSTGIDISIIGILSLLKSVTMMSNDKLYIRLPKFRSIHTQSDLFFHRIYSYNNVGLLVIRPFFFIP